MATAPTPDVTDIQLRLECLRLSGHHAPDARTVVDDAQKLYDFCKGTVAKPPAAE